MWSLGVIAYILLTGLKPFTGNSDTEVFKAVKQGEVNFYDISWLGISKEAKALVMELLNRDPTQRPSALQALHSEWMRNTSVHVDNEEFVKAAHNLKEFNSENLFKRAAYQFISKSLLTQDEKSPINKIFKTFDKEGNGRISQKDFIEGYRAHFLEELP